MGTETHTQHGTTNGAPATGDALQGTPSGAQPEGHTPQGAGEQADGQTLSVTDNRTGKTTSCPSPTARCAPWTCARSRPARMTSG